MKEIIHNGLKFKANSDLFRAEQLDGSLAITIRGNHYSDEIDEFTGKPRSNSRGSLVALIDTKLEDFAICAEMKLLACHLDGFPQGGWLGVALRAQDADNFELVWFMPAGGGESNNVAYVPVAHGVVPWWTEAYEKQNKGAAKLDPSDWFDVRVEVRGDSFSVFSGGEFVFQKTMTYYLTSGMAGLFAGTATDAAFRNVRIETL